MVSDRLMVSEVAYKILVAFSYEEENVSSESQCEREGLIFANSLLSLKYNFSGYFVWIPALSGVTLHDGLRNDQRKGIRITQF